MDSLISSRQALPVKQKDYFIAIGTIIDIADSLDHIEKWSIGKEEVMIKESYIKKLIWKTMKVFTLVGTVRIAIQCGFGKKFKKMLTEERKRVEWSALNEL